jgi:hypothetical protein
MTTTFHRLNNGWNAEPNAPEPQIVLAGDTLRLKFLLNTTAYPGIPPSARGQLGFHQCVRYRLGPTNDEGWYSGQCRFSKLAPSWGEFYEVKGDLLLAKCPADWITVAEQEQATRHFLFYLRDETFECDATSWRFSAID